MAREKLEYDVKLNTKKASAEAKEFKKRIGELNEEVDSNIDGLQALDTLTGGYASKVKDAKDQISGGIKFVKAFTNTFKGLKTAIIATGIGALVVAVGLLIAYWDQIKDFVTGTSRKLEEQNKVLEQNTEELDAQSGILEKQRKILELSGKSTKEITEQIKQQKLAQIENNKLLVDNLKTQIEIKKAEVDSAWFSKTRNARQEELNELQNKLNAAVQSQLDIETEILETEAEVKENRQQAVLDAILLNDEMKQFAKESWAETLAEIGDASAMSFMEAFTKKVQEEEFDPNAVLFLDEDLMDLEDPDSPLGASLAANDRYVNEIARQQTVIDDAKKNTFNNVLSLTNAETALGKAAIIAKNVMAAKEMIIEAKKTLAFSQSAVANSLTAVAEGTAKTAKIGFPQNIPMLIAYAAQAAGIIGSVRNAVKSSKGSVSVPDVNVAAATQRAMPETESQSPAFNIVGSSGSNQIAEALAGSNNRPIKTYVVAGDVTTAQEMDRKTVQSASLG
jgi:hypothetical protein